MSELFHSSSPHLIYILFTKVEGFFFFLINYYYYYYYNLWNNLNLLFEQVNSSGVMPIIFSTSSLALPATLARFTGLNALKNAAVALNPGGKICDF